MSEGSCPLCRKRPIKKKLVLYGVPVCKKCYYAFANRRQIAYLIDLIVWQICTALPLYFIFSILAGALASRTPQGASQASITGLEVLANVLPYLLFLIFAMKDGFSGKSLGKLACGVTVLDEQTYQPAGFMHSFKRNLILIVPILPLVIAFLLQKGHRLGDGWADTKVVWDKYRNHPLFTGQLACTGCQYDLRGSVSATCPECGHPIPASTRKALDAAGPPQLVVAAR